jgi:hypothetical protein
MSHGLKGKTGNATLPPNKRKTITVRRLIEPDFADWLRSRNGLSPADEIINIARSAYLVEMGAK